MARKRGLGKGLDALIPSGEELQTAGGGVVEIPIDELLPNPRQPRTTFEEEDLRGLADSIREHGVLQPLIATQAEEGEGHVLIAGERRLQAARLAGLRAVPVIVRRAGEQERLELALVENLQRADLSPLEVADGYRMLAEDFNLSHEEIAARVGRSRAAVSNTLRLLKLAPAVREALSRGEISEGHARALLGLSAPQAQAAGLQTILKRGLNVRQTEELVRRLTGERRKPVEVKGKTPDELALEDELRQALGTRVTLRRGKQGGSLVIRFFSDEDLNAVVDRILGKD